MARNQHNDYFQMFIDLAQFSCQAAQKLDHVLRHFNVDTLAEEMEQLHAIEHAADLQHHELIRKLAKEFITPIEREDIMSIARRLDDVTDSVEEILRQIYMFHIEEITPQALLFSRLIVRCCDALYRVMEEFKNFRKSKNLHQMVIDLNQLEEEGDRLHMEAIRATSGQIGENPLSVVAWLRVYDQFEECCDTCEDVTALVGDAVMKNT